MTDASDSLDRLLDTSNEPAHVCCLVVDSGITFTGGRIGGQGNVQLLI